MSAIHVRCARCAAAINSDSSICTDCTSSADATFDRVIAFPAAVRPIACRLTVKDYFLLEHWCREFAASDPLVADIARPKLAGAQILRMAEVTPDLVTLDSRVTFLVDDRAADMRTLVHWDSALIVGMTLSIATPLGMTLIGTAAGDRVSYPDRDGGWHSVAVEQIAHQPEAARNHVRGRSREGAPRPGRCGPTLVPNEVAPGQAMPGPSPTTA